MKKFIAILLFLFLLSPIFGTDYFVKNGGNDGADGESDGNAWETWGKVKGESYNAGDVIYFKRGSTWNIGTNAFWNFTLDGTGVNYITLDAYDSGTLPIIDAEVTLTGGWTEYGAAASVYAETVDTAYQHSTIDNIRTVHNAADLSGSGTQVRVKFVATTMAGRWTYIDGASIGKRSGASDDYTAGTFVRLQFSSSNTAVMTTGTTLWSDWATLPQAFDDSVDYMTHHYQIDSGRAGQVGDTTNWQQGGEVGFVGYQGSEGSDESQNATWTSDGSPANLIWSISDIEVRTAENIWQKTPASNADVTRCRLDGQDSYQAANIGEIDGVTYNWYWAGGVLYVYATENPDTAYSAVKVTHNTAYVFRMQGTTYIKFQNLRLAGAEAAFIFLNGFDQTYIEINNCDIWYGVRGIRVTQAAGGGNTTNNITVDGNDFDGKLNYLNLVGEELQVCCWDAMLIQNECDDWIISNNTFTDWGHTAIGLRASEGAPTQGVNNFIIENNTIDGTNSPYLRAFACQGDEGKCTGNVFRYNIDKNTNVRNQIGGNNNLVYYNLIYNKTETTVTDKSNVSEGLRLEPSEGDACNNNVIYNNIFYDIFNEGIGLGAYASVNTNLIKNNIVMNAGQGGDELNIAFNYLNVAGVNTISNNCFYDSGTSDVINYKGTEETVAEADAGRAEFSSNVGADPKFIDAANDDFRLLMASPCVNAGTDVSLTRDYRGRSIRHAPDIGAYEDPTNAVFMSAELFSFSDLWLLWNERLSGLAWWEELGVYLKERE